MVSCLDGLPDHREGAVSFALRRWRIQARFRRKVGRRLNCDSPGIFQEKTQYRKLYGNHALYAFLADKYRVREYVAERVGAHYLVPLLGVHEQLTPEVFADLPPQFIIKATHGCKWHQIVRDKSQLDIPATVRRFNQLLSRRHGRTSGEYHYRLITPRIVIETLLDDGGESPADYDFFCFHDGSSFDYRLAVAMPGGQRAVHFEKDWRVSDGNCTAAEVEQVKEPPNFAEMLWVAERLSQGFDFLRIDLYNVAGRIFFGEVTCTPAGGMQPISSPARGAAFNALWKLDRGNSLLYRRA